MKRSDVEDELETFGMKRRAQPFLNFCEENGGQLDMRMVDDVACAFGPGDIDRSRDFEDEVRGNLTVISVDVGFPRFTVQHWADGEHISNTYLGDCRISEEGDIHCEDTDAIRSITPKW